jgi:transcriptional regulator GlxA family with amidase domain
LYCKPQLLANLARNNGIENWWLLDEINRHPTDRVWHRQMELPPALYFIGKCLLESPYRRAVRLMNAEAKALELLCEILTRAQDGSDTLQPLPSDNEARVLESARRLVSAHLDQPLRIYEIAKSVGMSESKLKRAFKARYASTIFDYGLECRMTHALDLLRRCRMPVGEVAFLVGYRHQTSFASAFHDYFGFLPSRARTEMH